MLNHLKALEGLHRQAEAARERAMAVKNIAKERRAAFESLESEAGEIEEITESEAIEAARLSFVEAEKRWERVWSIRMYKDLSTDRNLFCLDTFQTD